MVCLTNINVDTLHKGDTKDNNNNNNNNNSWVIKSRIMRWAGHVKRME